MCKKLILTSLALILPLALVGCECLWAWTDLYANRDVPAVEYLSAKEIYICSGESALLHWSSHRKITRAWLEPTLGEVSPRGQTIVSPLHTMEYVLTAEGEGCRAGSRATVHVVRPGDTVSISAVETYDPFTDSYYWKVETKEQIISPDILVNSVQADRETDQVGPWTVSKMDRNGLVHELVVPEDRPVSPGERFTVLGTWSFWPEKNYEGKATFILRIECQS